MKKILIITYLLFSCMFLALAQETLHDKFINLKIPAGLSRTPMDKNQVDKTQQKENTLEKKTRVGSLSQEKFTGNGVIKYLQYTSGEFDAKPNYLEERKQLLYNLFTSDGTKPLPKGYSSAIKVFNNCEALIVKNEIDEYIKYSILTIDKAHSKYFNTTIVSLKKEAITADKAVDSFIKSIQFK